MTDIDKLRQQIRSDLCMYCTDSIRNIDSPCPVMNSKGKKRCPLIDTIDKGMDKLEKLTRNKSLEMFEGIVNDVDGTIVSSAKIEKILERIKKLKQPK